MTTCVLKTVLNCNGLDRFFGHCEAQKNQPNCVTVLQLDNNQPKDLMGWKVFGRCWTDKCQVPWMSRGNHKVSLLRPLLHSWHNKLPDLGGLVAKWRKRTLISLWFEWLRDHLIATNVEAIKLKVCDQSLKTPHCPAGVLKTRTADEWQGVFFCLFFSFFWFP